MIDQFCFYILKKERVLSFLSSKGCFGSVLPKQVLLFVVVLNAYSHTHLILSAAITFFSISV